LDTVVRALKESELEMCRNIWKFDVRKSFRVARNLFFGVKRRKGGEIGVKILVLACCKKLDEFGRFSNNLVPPPPQAGEIG